MNVKFTPIIFELRQIIVDLEFYKKRNFLPATDSENLDWRKWSNETSSLIHNPDFREYKIQLFNFHLEKKRIIGFKKIKIQYI